MIGRARPGDVRPWQPAAAITALRAAFPQAKVLPQRHTLVGCSDLVVTEPIEDLQSIESWFARRLRIAFPVLAACADEASVTRLIEEAVPRMERGVVVSIGLGQPAPEPAPKPRRRGQPRQSRPPASAAPDRPARRS